MAVSINKQGNKQCDGSFASWPAKTGALKVMQSGGSFASRHSISIGNKGTAHCFAYIYLPTLSALPVWPRTTLLFCLRQKRQTVRKLSG